MHVIKTHEPLENRNRLKNTQGFWCRHHSPLCNNLSPHNSNKLVLSLYNQPFFPIHTTTSSSSITILSIMSQPKLTLHHLESSQSLRMLWALEELAKEKGLKFDFKIYPRTVGPQPELAKLTGYATSPILTVEYPDGKVSHRTESRLLLDWLNQNVGDHIWTPSSEDDRERDIFFQEYAKTTFELRVTFLLLFEVVPQNSPWFIRPIMNIFYAPVAKHFRNDLSRFIQPLEDALQENEWFGGAQIGISDFMLSFGMDMAVQRGYITKQQWPKFWAWHERYTSRECYKKALGEGGKYDLAF